MPTVFGTVRSPNPTTYGGWYSPSGSNPQPVGPLTLTSYIDFDFEKPDCGTAHNDFTLVIQGTITFPAQTDPPFPAGLASTVEVGFDVDGAGVIEPSAYCNGRIVGMPPDSPVTPFPPTGHYQIGFTPGETVNFNITLTQADSARPFLQLRCGRGTVGLFWYPWIRWVWLGSAWSLHPPETPGRTMLGPLSVQVTSVSLTYTDSATTAYPCCNCEQDPPDEDPPDPPAETGTAIEVDTFEDQLTVVWADPEDTELKVATHRGPLGYLGNSTEGWETTQELDLTVALNRGGLGVWYTPTGDLFLQAGYWSQDSGTTYETVVVNQPESGLVDWRRTEWGLSAWGLGGLDIGAQNTVALYQLPDHDTQEPLQTDPNLPGRTWEVVNTPPHAFQTWAGAVFRNYWQKSGVLWAFNGTWRWPDQNQPPSTDPGNPWEWTPPSEPVPGPAPIPPPPPSPTPVPQPSPTPGALPGYGPFPYGYGTSVSGIAWDVDIPAGVYTSGQWRISWTIAATYGPGGAAVTTRTGASNVASTSVRNTTGVFTDLVTVTALQLADINAAAGGTLSAEFDVTSINCAGQVTSIELLLV